MKKNYPSQSRNQIERQKIIQFLKEKASCNLYLLIMPGRIFVVVEKKLVTLQKKKIIKILFSISWKQVGLIYSFNKKV